MLLGRVFSYFVRLSVTVMYVAICFSEDEIKAVRSIRDSLLSIGGVDAILLSHCDLQHIGGLPIVCGTEGKCKRL